MDLRDLPDLKAHGVKMGDCSQIYSQVTALKVSLQNNGNRF